jgi:membrane protease YdiL (CAAX protease family)
MRSGLYSSQQEISRPGTLSRVAKLGLKRAAQAALVLGAGLGWIRMAGSGQGAPSLDAAGWAALGSSTALALFAWALAQSIPGPPGQLLQLPRPRRPLPTWGLALAVAGMLGLSLAVGELLTRTGLLAGGPLERLNHLLAGATEAQLLGAMLSMALAPAFAEELLFRGLLLGRFCKRLGTLSGLLLSSALFALIHGEPGQALAAFPLGLYLGALTLRTGSVHTAILCHAVNNLAAIAAAARAHGAMVGP